MRVILWVTLMLLVLGSYDLASGLKVRNDETVGGLRFSGETIHAHYSTFGCSADGEGCVQWNKTYGGAGSDSAYSVQQTGDGGYIIAGATSSFGAGGDDWWLIKTDAHGNMEWNKTYGGAGVDEWARSVQQTADGGYIAAGITTSFGAGHYDAWLIKTDTYGNMEWNRTYGGSDLDEAYCVQETSDGGYVVAGRTYSFDLTNMGDVWVIKTDAFGNVEWSRISGWPDWDMAYSIQQTADGGYIVAGWRFSSYDTRRDTWLIKLDTYGELEWDRVYAGPGQSEEEAHCVRQTADGGYIVAGTNLNDFLVIKTDAYGNVEKSMLLGGAGSDWAESVQQTSDGGYIVAGCTGSFGAGDWDFWVVKLFIESELVPVIDVAVTDVSPSKTIAGQGFPLPVKVTIENMGNVSRIFNVTVYANATAIGTQRVYVMPETTRTITINANTTGIALGNHSISAYIAPTPDENKTDDNTLVDGWVFITILGDVDGDFKVKMDDIMLVCDGFGSKVGHPKYDSNCDINDDKKIGIDDIIIAVENFGKHYQ